jgi:hypothetical protein
MSEVRDNPLRKSLASTHSAVELSTRKEDNENLDIPVTGDGSDPNREESVEGESGKIKSSPMIELRNDKIIKIIEYVNVIFALTGAIYFLSQRRIFICLEYAQISFISTLVVVLDNESKYIQRMGLLVAACIGGFWGTIYSIAAVESETTEIGAIICAGMGTTSFLGSMVFLVYVIAEINSSPSTATTGTSSMTTTATATIGKNMKCAELDLILYLISLNAICFFSSNQHFNNNLHMILDIRTMVMLFSGIYQEKDKMKLVQIFDFLVIMILIMISFILFSFSETPFQMTGNSIYIIIGGILWKEGFVARSKYLKRMKRRQQGSITADGARLTLERNSVAP